MIERHAVKVSDKVPTRRCTTPSTWLLNMTNSATRYSVTLPPSMEGSCHGKFEELSCIIHAEGVRGCCTTSNLRVEGDSPGTLARL